MFLELWPTLVFLARYGKRFHNRRVIIFIDNTAVRDALSKGSSPLCDLFCTLALCSYYISSNSLCSWFTRVASDSNPGDDPSRGRAKEMAELIRAELATSLVAPEALVNSIVTVESFIDFMRESVHSRGGLQPIENGGGGCAITSMSEKMVCRNFLFHTPLPKASIQQLLNEEKAIVIILISNV